MTERVEQERDDFAKAKRDTWNTTDYGSWFKPARGQVIDTLEALANMLLQIFQALLPVGDVILPLLEGLANGIAAKAPPPSSPSASQATLAAR